MSATKALAAGRHSPTVTRARNDLSSAPSDLNSSFMTSSLHRTKDRQIRRRHSPSKGGLLSRSFTKTPYIVDRAEGHCYILEDDRAIYDLSGGASVSYLGPGSNKKILAAARAQEDRVSYTASYSLTTRIAAKYADALLTTTNGVVSTLHGFSLKSPHNR
jgi:4-aminobutyrate aminotransferase-like enzyme